MAKKEMKFTAKDCEIHGPLKRYTFQNNEDQAGSVDVQFSFEGMHCGPFLSGRQYNVPEGVADHVNSLRIPVREIRLDQETGQMKSVVTGFKNRFTMLEERGAVVPQPDRPKRKQPEKEAA